MMPPFCRLEFHDTNSSIISWAGFRAEDQESIVEARAQGSDCGSGRNGELTGTIKLSHSGAEA